MSARAGGSAHWTDALGAPATRWLAGRDVDELECVVPDMAGTARGKAMTERKFAQLARQYLPASIFFQTITGEYVDLDWMPDQWIESDTVLVPDFDTATAVPWSADVTLQIVHDVHRQDGEPLAFAPRNVLRRVIDAYARRGWRPVVAPEMEFYLTKPNTDPDYPIEPPVGRTGRQGIAQQAYSMSAVEEYGRVIDVIYDYADAQGFAIDTIIQESGAGQIEINLAHGDPLTLADQVFFHKRSIREAAIKNGCFATFMAKPMQHQPGSAMHLHQSIVEIDTGRNVFNGDDGEPTDLFHGFLSGQQVHLPAVVPILAPYVNSYRRFVADDAAPINLEWGVDNRTTGLRVPASSPESRRVENRVVGMDCNPYLAIAASLACGLLGMLSTARPRDPVPGNAYSLPRALPRDLLAALDLFSRNDEITELLGTDFCALYRAIKQAESEAFDRVISPWEREHLLLNV